jgi:D-sedoheptulose 7-phosphate isomerase
MNGLDEWLDKRPSPTAFAGRYLTCLTEVLSLIDRDQVATFIQTLIDARLSGARIFFIGNGGSASTASHFANDVGIGSRTWHKPFRAISLCDNLAVVTALANDYGYADVFVRQLMVQMQSGDVVVAISVSGNSPNILKAVRYANDNGGITVGLTGFDGGELRRIARVAVHVPTNRGEYGPAEDAHMVIDHLVGAFLIRHCASETAQSV